MLEAMSFPFMQRALAGGLLIAFLAGFYGTFVVQRGLSFLGSGLAHGAFGGVAVALFFGTEPLYVALPFTVLVSLGITFVRERTGLGRDTTVGIFFAVSVALGVVVLSLKKEYTADAFNYLFGSILSITRADLVASSLLVFLSLLSWPLWKRWAYATFDRDLALSDGISVHRDDYLLSAIIAVTVVMAVKIVGIVLIAAFLVVPAATSRLLTPTFFLMSLLSILMGMFSVVSGLWFSYRYDIPTGATVVLVQAALFFLVMIAAPLLRRLTFRAREARERRL